MIAAVPARGRLLAWPTAAASAVTGTPAKKAVEQVRSISALTQVQPMEIVDGLMEQAGQVNGKADLIVLVISQERQPRPSARPRLPAGSAQPERAHGQMS